MVETPLLHRDGTGGLFIGTSMFLFALMNSAPAELLHPLTYAALQPSIGHQLANKFTALTNLGLAMRIVPFCTSLYDSASQQLATIYSQASMPLCGGDGQKKRRQ